MSTAAHVTFEEITVMFDSSCIFGFVQDLCLEYCPVITVAMHRHGAPVFL
jgi:hypothetical protein